MPGIKVLKSVLNEYGASWTVNRLLYNVKLKSMSIIPASEELYEKQTAYPKRLDLFLLDVETLRTFLRNKLSSEDKNQLIAIADKAYNGVIMGFSSIELNYGNPIDWQLNPLSGRRCNKNVKWYKIPDFDKDRGDIKVIWEASRFSHFITLSRAYLLTEDEKYYKAFSSQLHDWLMNNSYNCGANFKCGQECALRMVNTLLSYSVFQACGKTTDADASNVKDLIDRCYRKILSNFFYAYQCIKNNHTISELMGMIIGAWCCEDQKQLERAYAILDEVIDEQFTLDGGYRQFSFNYQRLVLQDLEVVMSVESRTGLRLSNHSKNRIKNAAMLMYQCQDESGDVPNYGPNDGALIFPVTSCGYRDFSPVINTAYAKAAGTQLYAAGKHQEELLWFSGGEGLEEYKTKVIKQVPSQFADAGLFTLRGPNSWAMIVSNDYHSRPAHMDQMHFDLWAEGVNILCDAGTYSYASEEGRKLARNESHNTAVVDGASQMNTYGPFMIYGWTERILGICDDSIFTGKCVSANGYTHIREIKQIGTSYEISDKVNKNFKVLFHTPCEVQLKDGKAVLSRNNKTLCEISSSGEISLQKGQRSLFYLQKEETNCLSISGKADKTIVTSIKIIGG